MSVLWQVCGNCESRPGSVFCPQDCAVLCRTCDASVHAPGGLAHRHVRVKLEPSRPAIFSSCTSEERGRTDELCDACKDATAFVFCRSEREMLCFACDNARHKGGGDVDGTAKDHVRFFIPGVRVGQEIQGGHPAVDVRSGASSLEDDPSATGTPDDDTPDKSVRRSGRKRKPPARASSPSEGIVSVGSQPTLEVIPSSTVFDAPCSSGGTEEWLDLSPMDDKNALHNEERRALTSRLVTQS